MSSSRGSWFAPEPRLSYDELKEMMAQAAEALKDRDEREKEVAKAKAKAKAVLYSTTPRGESVLTESKAFNIHVRYTADSAKVAKHDRRSVSAREPRAAAFARAGLPPSSRAAFEKWKGLRAEVTVTGEHQVSEESSEPSKLGKLVKPSDNEVLGGGNGRKAGNGHPVLSVNVEANADAIDPYKIGDNSAPDKLSRTKEWVDDTLTLQGFAPAPAPAPAVDRNTSEGGRNTESEVPVPPTATVDARRLAVSPEIQEEEEEDLCLEELENSAHIEDQLPGRLSQSVRFIKPGSPAPVFFSREQKKKSNFAFRAFSAKLASKLGRLFSSKSAKRSPSHMSSGGSLESPSESSRMKSASLHKKWLQKQSPKPPGDEATRDKTETVRAGPRLQQPVAPKSGKVEPRLVEVRRKGKENMEVRHTFTPPLEGASHANSMVSKAVDSSQPASATSSSSTCNTSSLPPSAGVSSPRVRAWAGISRLSEKEHRNLWSRHYDTAVAPKKQVTPQEFLTSVLGWEPSLGELRIRTPTKDCPVKRIWPEQGNSPTGPGDDVLSKTRQRTGQPGRPIDIDKISAVPSLPVVGNDPVGSGAALAFLTSTGSGFEANSPSDTDPEDDVSDSDMEDYARILNLVDYDAFSLLPSTDS